MITLTDAPPKPPRSFVSPAWLNREALRVLSARLEAHERPRIVLTDAEPEIADPMVGVTINVRPPARFAQADRQAQ